MTSPVPYPPGLRPRDLETSRRTAIVAVLLPALLLSAAVLAAEPPVIDDDVEATYRQVTWDDFRSKRRLPPPAVAGIATTVVVEILDVEEKRLEDGRIEAHAADVWVYSMINKLESAYARGGRSDWVLAHEQGHFDLAEIHARRLRREISELTATGSSPVAARQELELRIVAAHQQVLASLAQMHERYDAETIHGSKKKAQKKWWKSIAGWLEETSAS